MEKKNFKSQIHLACSNDELRPVLNYIFFEDGYAVATDAHILIKQKLELHDFSDEEIEQMNGKALHGSKFKDILKYHHVQIKEGKIHCLNKKGVSFEFDFDDVSDMKFVNYQAVIPTSKDVTEISEIAVSSILISKVQKLVVNDAPGKSIVLRLHGANKSILMRSCGKTLEEEMILLMPTMIN